MSTN
jgi:hypothetical protein